MSLHHVSKLKQLTLYFGGSHWSLDSWLKVPVPTHLSLLSWSGFSCSLSYFLLYFVIFTKATRGHHLTRNMNAGCRRLFSQLTCMVIFLMRVGMVNMFQNLKISFYQMFTVGKHCGRLQWAVFIWTMWLWLGVRGICKTNPSDLYGIFTVFYFAYCFGSIFIYLNDLLVI